MAWKTLIVAAAVAVSACGSGAEQPPRELHRVRSGNVDVVLLSTDGAISKGTDTFTIEFRGTDGGLLDVGTVKAKAMMPMAGMGPMAGEVNVQPSGSPGRYLVSSNLSMAGTWRIDLEWAGPAGSGMATLSTAAQ